MASNFNPFLHDNRPGSVAQCFDDDGSFDEAKFHSFTARRDDEQRQLIAAAVDESYAQHYLSDDEMQWGDVDGEEVPKKRRKKKCVMACCTEDGELGTILPTDTIWYLVYVNNPPVEDKQFQDKFRNRFCLPHANFVALVEDCKEQEFFSRWMGKDAIGKSSSPIELLILGSLRYLGRGWTFDDLEEATAISREVHRCFFHQFVEFGSTVLYDRYVVFPTNYEEAKRHMIEFKLAGLNGNVGSTDGTHVTSEKCEYNLKQNHKGGKTSATTRTFNTTVNHRRRVLYSTKGGPGRWNDKTIVRFDKFVMGIRLGEYLEDVEYELLERGPDGTVLTVKY